MGADSVAWGWGPGPHRDEPYDQDPSQASCGAPTSARTMSRMLTIPTVHGLPSPAYAGFIERGPGDLKVTSHQSELPATSRFARRAIDNRRASAIQGDHTFWLETRRRHHREPADASHGQRQTTSRTGDCDRRSLNQVLLADPEGRMP